MRYIITIAAFQNENGSNTEGGKYLLIDEIENGLHYTVQEEFWKMLFKLAITYDIQIFAATHSREMIAAFDKTALEFEKEAAYFELYRHIKTNEIAANKIRPEVLEYKLENDKPMRGE
jgi:AAA15 family ATPase/GTPase